MLSRTAVVGAFVMSLAILLVPLSHPVAAGPEPPTLSATAYNTQRKVARATDGTVYAAVTVNASGLPQVRVIRTSDGVTWSPLPNPSTTGNWSDRASLAIDSIGRLHLAWTEPAAIDRQVFYAMYDGTEWSPMNQLSHSPGYAGFPSVAVDGTDRVRVVWYGFDGAFYQVYYRGRSDSVWSEEHALTHEAVDATNPAIALDPSGTIHVAWFRQNRAGTYTEIAYLRTDGVALLESTVLSTPGIPSLDPSVVIDGVGGVHVVWTARINGTSRIEAAHRTISWSPVETVSANFQGEHPSLALDGNSRLHVAWEGVDGHIYLQVRDGTWSAPAPITTTGTNRYPSLRWSQHVNPLCGDNAELDLIWTQEDAGATRVSYRAIEAAVPCTHEAAGFDWPIIAGLVLAVGTTGFVFFVVVVRRRWYPKPPVRP